MPSTGETVTYDASKLGAIARQPAGRKKRRLAHRLTQLRAAGAFRKPR